MPILPDKYIPELKETSPATAKLAFNEISFSVSTVAPPRRAETGMEESGYWA